MNGSEYPFIFYSPSNNTSTTLSFVVKGNPFSGNSISYDSLVIRPNDIYVNKHSMKLWMRLNNFC